MALAILSNNPRDSTKSQEDYFLKSQSSDILLKRTKFQVMSLTFVFLGYQFKVFMNAGLCIKVYLDIKIENNGSFE